MNTWKIVIVIMNVFLKRMLHSLTIDTSRILIRWAKHQRVANANPLFPYIFQNKSNEPSSFPSDLRLADNVSVLN